MRKMQVHRNNGPILRNYIATGTYGEASFRRSSANEASLRGDLERIAKGHFVPLRRNAAETAGRMGDVGPPASACPFITSPYSHRGCSTGHPALRGSRLPRGGAL